MRPTKLVAVLLLTLSAPAQDWHVPDADPTTGICNVIPFGDAPGSQYGNSKMQTRCTAADLGNQAGVITGIGFASCDTGIAQCDLLRIVLDHIPTNQALSTTFANNVTANAQTVLEVSDYTWLVDADAWNEVGLQSAFAYNGTDDLLVEITAVNAVSTSRMHRGTRQRVLWSGPTGPAPATGASQSNCVKLQISMGTARTSRHGLGCAGSNGTPQLAFAGAPQIGQSFAFELGDGPVSGLGVLVVGDGNAGPFPVELSGIGMPLCYAFTNILGSAALSLDAAGAASVALNVPVGLSPGLLFYGQFACLDPAANAFGLTTSNYGRVLVGL